MDHRKSKGAGSTAFRLDISRGTLVIEGWPALLLAGALLAARVILGLTGVLPIPLEPHLGLSAASAAQHETSHLALPPADGGMGAHRIRTSRLAP